MSISLQPLISWEKEIGVASCRWVRPVFTMPSFSAISLVKVSVKRSIAGNSLSSISITAAMCMAVGKVSLELWDMLEWSFGWRSFSPAMAFPRPAMTSFTFILDWVPLPVCHTASGKLSSSLPASISSQACEIRARRLSSSFPRRLFAIAAAFFKMAKARITSMGIFSVPIGKFWKLLWVWAPQ